MKITIEIVTDRDVSQVSAEEADTIGIALIDIGDFVESSINALRDNNRWSRHPAYNTRVVGTVDAAGTCDAPTSWKVTVQ